MRPIFYKMAIILTVFFMSAAGAYGQTLYATDGASCNPSTLYEIDPADGSVIRTIGSTGVSGLRGLAEHPLTGVLYAVSTGGGGCTPNLYSLNKTTGVATLIGGLGVSGGKPGMAFRSDGTLFCLTGPSGLFLGTVNLDTGAITVIGDTGVGMHDNALTFDASGILLMDSQYSIYTVDTTTGAAAYLSTKSPETNDAGGMATHPDTGAIYIADRTSGGVGGPTLIYTIVPATGQMTLLGSNALGLIAMAFSGDHTPPPQPIPTLSEWGMIIMSLILAGSAIWMMRRRQVS